VCRRGDHPPLGAGIALSVVLILIVVPAAVIDLEHRIIPNKITALGAVLALVLARRSTRP